MGVVLDVDGDSALLVVGCAVSVGAAADACAAIPALRAGHIVAAARGLGDGAAGDVNGDNALLAVVFGVTAAAADACAAVFATRGLGDGAALDDDVGLAGRVFAAADAGAAISALRFDFGSAADDDIGVAGSTVTAANAGSTGSADGFDVAAYYLNGAGTSATTGFAPGAADTSRATAACGSQAAGVVAILICFGCDGQFAGGSAAIALFVVLKAGMFAVAGEGIVALERDRRVARALDAEGGVVVGLNVDILQRHVEGAVFDLVDDSDDVVGDVFGCVPEVFRRGLQGRGRFVPGLFVVIGVGDLEGWAGVRDLAFQHGASAGLGLFREISLVFLAAGGATGLVLVFLAAALGVAEVDLVFGFAVAVVFGVKRGQIGLGGRLCEGGAFRRVAAGRAAAGGGIRWVRAALDDDVAVRVIFCAVALLDLGAVFVFGDGDVTIAYVIDIRIRRCSHAGHHCGCQRQRRHPVRRGPGGCRHPQRMPQNAHCKLAIRDHRNLL